MNFNKAGETVTKAQLTWEGGKTNQLTRNVIAKYHLTTNTQLKILTPK